MLNIHYILNNITVETEEQRLIFKALGMIRDRALFYESVRDIDHSTAYESAADILAYAMMGDVAALNNFDYYDHEQPYDVAADLEDEWKDWNYNEDMGFDPYMGCYTDDC